ncbi:MAG: LapA family protein [Candidatus Omnitrophica bacterium]|nr:LapA family protein [Candidatus Omnitrophota bacterium]
MNWKMGVVAGLIGLLLVFIMQNQTPVKVSFLFWSFATSRAMIIFITLLCGFVSGWVSALFIRKRS